MKHTLKQRGLEHRCTTCNKVWGYLEGLPLPEEECPGSSVKKAVKCIVRGCPNYSDAGRMVGDLCATCYEAVNNGTVHHRFMIDRLAPWKPIETAPYDKLVMVKGPSGMSGIGAPDYQMTAFRVRDWHQGEFNNHQGDRITEGNQAPTHWREIL